MTASASTPERQPAPMAEAAEAARAARRMAAAENPSSQEIREMAATSMGVSTVNGKAVELSGRLLKTVRLTEEAFADLDDPESFVAELKRAGTKADLFTFCQRLPDTQPRYGYPRVWETIAVLPITTYDNWYKSQINNKTRNLIVKAKKKGVEVRPATFDDAFVAGMTAIFNETPIRQERPFRHFGKSFATVKREFSRYLFREDLLGAYLNDELIGFIMLADAGRFATMTQVISMLRHRDKSPNNALIAKAVEICAARKIPHLVYALWPRGHLREFKRHNAFEPVNLPRFYVPLTMKGRIALKLGLHRSPSDYLPEPTVMFFRDIRSRYYAYRHKPVTPLRASAGTDTTAA